MNVREISKAYAEALFAARNENFETDKYFINLLLNVFNKNPEYKEFLKSPQIPLSKRLLGIREAFGDFLPKEYIYFLEIICKNNDIDKVTLVFREYLKLFNTAQKIKIVKVTSAAMLENGQIDKLTKKFKKISGQNVVLEIVIDKNLIGGIKAELDGKVFDLSLKRRLDLLKETVKK